MTFVAIKQSSPEVVPTAVFIDPLQGFVEMGLEPLKRRIRVSKTLGRNPIQEGKALFELECACKKWEQERRTANEAPIAA